RRFHHRDLLAFPTRRSSDLIPLVAAIVNAGLSQESQETSTPFSGMIAPRSSRKGERLRVAVNGRGIKGEGLFGFSSRITHHFSRSKSTRLNSSHVSISYAVF